MTKPPASPWLEIRALSFRHGREETLRDVSLSFRPGRHYILAGPNGAGKSTLFDLLTGLRRPAEGGITLMGRPREQYGAAAARLLALAPQEFRLNFSFTVRELVGMGRRPYLNRWGRLSLEDHAAVNRALAALDLSGLADKPVTALSGGEKQRAVTARALAQECPILLLDEPTAGLDIAHALKLMEVARQKAEAGGLVITVTHDLNLGAAFGHEFVFLQNGRLAAAGPTTEVFTSDIISRVYSAETLVRPDDWSGGLAASFRSPANRAI